MNRSASIYQIIEHLKSPPHGQGEQINQDIMAPLHRKQLRSKACVLVTDVSSGVFRYACLERKKEATVIISYGELSRQHLGVESDDALDLYRAGLACVEAGIDFKIRDILVVSSKLDFFIRSLKLPLTRKSEIERAAKWEIEKQIPIKTAESYLKIKKEEIQDRFCRLAVGAVPKNQINRWQFLDKRLIGIVPTSVAMVPIGPPALAKDISYCYIFQDNSSIFIGFYNSDGLQYSQPVISRVTDFAFETEEPAISPLKIVDELSSGIEVFYSYFPGMRVGGIVLIMRPDEISEVAPLIKNNIVIDVIPVNYPENIDTSEFCGGLKLDARYFPLLGAAKIDSSDFRFLPRALEDNIKSRIIRKIIYYFLIIGVATLVMFSLFWIAGMKIRNSRLKAVIEQKIKIEDSEAYKKSREYLARTNSLLYIRNQFARINHVSSDLYVALSDITPGNVHISGLTLKSDRDPELVEISGFYDGDLARADAAILALIDNLRNFGLTNIELKRLGQKLSGNKKTESFTVTGEYARNG